MLVFKERERKRCNEQRKEKKKKKIKKIIRVLVVP